MNPSRSEGAAQLTGCNPKLEPEPVTNWTNQDSLNKTTLTHSAPQTQARAGVRAPHGFASRSYSCSSCSSVLFFFFLSFSLSLFPSSFISIDIHTLILLTIVYAVCLFFIHCFQCSEGGLHIRFWVCTFVRCILYYIPSNSGRCVMSSL